VGSGFAFVFGFEMGFKNVVWLAWIRGKLFQNQWIMLCWCNGLGVWWWLVLGGGWMVG
jgi:hypothetical protein